MNIDLLEWIREACKQVPEVKYAFALGVIALILAVVLDFITELGISIELIVVAIVIVLLLMVVLICLTNFKHLAVKDLLMPIKVLIWFALFFFMAMAIFVLVYAGEKIINGGAENKPLPMGRGSDEMATLSPPWTEDCLEVDDYFVVDKESVRVRLINNCDRPAGFAIRLVQDSGIYSFVSSGARFYGLPRNMDRIHNPQISAIPAFDTITVGASIYWSGICSGTPVDVVVMETDSVTRTQERTIDSKPYPVTICDPDVLATVRTNDFYFPSLKPPTMIPAWTLPGLRPRGPDNVHYLTSHLYSLVNLNHQKHIDRLERRYGRERVCRECHHWPNSRDVTTLTGDTIWNCWICHDLESELKGQLLRVRFSNKYRIGHEEDRRSCGACHKRLGGPTYLSTKRDGSCLGACHDYDLHKILSTRQDMSISGSSEKFRHLEHIDGFDSLTPCLGIEVQLRYASGCVACHHRFFAPSNYDDLPIWEGDLRNMSYPEERGDKGKKIKCDICHKRSTYYMLSLFRDNTSICQSIGCHGATIECQQSRAPVEDSENVRAKQIKADEGNRVDTTRNCAPIEYQQKGEPTIDTEMAHVMEIKTIIDGLRDTIINGCNYSIFRESIKCGYHSRSKFKSMTTADFKRRLSHCRYKLKL